MPQPDAMIETSVHHDLNMATVGVSITMYEVAHD